MVESWFVLKLAVKEIPEALRNDGANRMEAPPPGVADEQYDGVATRVPNNIANSKGLSMRR